MKKNFLKAGVVGWPIDHSLSPYVHGFWLNEHSINGEYISRGVKSEDFPAFLQEIVEKEWRGINITLPHKNTAFKIVDKLDKNARRMGAVNTVIVTANGTLKGINTDGYGFLKNLEQHCPSLRLDKGPSVVLGAGGAARAILLSLLDNGVSEIRLANRNKSKAEKLAFEFNGPISVYDWSDRSNILTEVNLLINATSLGMVGQASLEIDLKKLPVKAVVNDIVYTPIETELLKKAKKRGNLAVGGLGMLLHQAVPGFSAWFNVAPKVTPSLHEYILEKMEN